ncbi:hypothetical protein DPV93_05285 [Haemophilus sputorum]|uniref:Uncharacterized protein n=1 Tax=Haemophilus sputorum TaxID=1078480 RepID=A0A369YIT0_9PAST|nr:hypothetical protein [Haemophilus sputorum]RDE72695.1 hypothetical protein DPV93_05285 [Haemophilus sputorum]
MKAYEYIYFDDEPTKEEVLEAISNCEWKCFKSSGFDLGWVAKGILEEKYNDWEMWDEDDTVYLVVREFNDDYWELHKVSICHSISAVSEEIYFDE